MIVKVQIICNYLNYSLAVHLFFYLFYVFSHNFVLFATWMLWSMKINLNLDVAPNYSCTPFETRF